MELTDSLHLQEKNRQHKQKKFVPKSMSSAVRLRKLAWKAQQVTTPVMYFVCLVLVVYIYFRDVLQYNEENQLFQQELDSFQFDDEGHSSDYSHADTANSMTLLKKPTEFEQVPQAFAGIMDQLSFLPIAPYEEVAKRWDFKAVQAVYIEHLKHFIHKSTESISGSIQPPTFNFNWKDFVDLKILDSLLEEKPSCFRIGSLGSTTRKAWVNCLDDPKNLGFVFVTPSLDPETEFRLSIRGKSYLHTAAQPPNKLVFLAGELAFVTKTHKKMSLEEGVMIDEFIQRKLDARLLQESKDPVARTETRIVVDEHTGEERLEEVEVPQTEITLLDIIREPVSAIDEMNEISTILKRDLINLSAPKTRFTDVNKDSFRFSSNIKERSQLANAARHHDDRHFRNVVIKSKDGNWASEEAYDWRFFNKKLNNLNKHKSLHGVVENYLQFCFNLGLTSWLAPDSMTAWAYNGMSGPWEETIKFELPAADLSRIANSFNYSLIISDPRNSSGNYLIDVSPWYLERAIHNDGGAAPDVADARIIDTSTGLYIELFGVTNAPRIPDNLLATYNDEDLKNYVCTGAGNFWYLPSLLPLNRTLYEGKMTNVPKTLPEDSADPPDAYLYKDHLRLFVTQDKCSYIPEEEKYSFDQGYLGCCHDNLIWKYYNATKYFTVEFLDLKQNPRPLNVLDEMPILF